MFTADDAKRYNVSKNIDYDIDNKVHKELLSLPSKVERAKLNGFNYVEFTIERLYSVALQAALEDLGYFVVSENYAITYKRLIVYWEHPKTWFGRLFNIPGW